MVALSEIGWEIKIAAHLWHCLDSSGLTSLYLTTKIRPNWALASQQCTLYLDGHYYNTDILFTFSRV